MYDDDDEKWDYDANDDGDDDFDDDTNDDNDHCHLFSRCVRVTVDQGSKVDHRRWNHSHLKNITIIVTKGHIPDPNGQVRVEY